MDEKFLDEIRRQERALKENEDENDAQTMLSEPIGEPAVAPPDGQTTLFGGDA
jgi:hypothetical protein